MEPASASEEIHHGFKKLTLANWREPTFPKLFPNLTEEKWVSTVMEAQLIEAVPQEVSAMFEVARGSILYGWFFYPLHTLASEQLYRVLEAAVRERCKAAGIPLTIDRVKNGKTFTQTRKYVELISELKKRKIIATSDVDMWDAARELRNLSSHPKSQTINFPTAAVAAIDWIALRINQLFAENHDFHSQLGLRVRRNSGLDRKDIAFPIVVGIDVAAPKKGFHLVCLHGQTIKGTHSTLDAAAAAAWCIAQGATLVSVDAPSGWSLGGQYRSREAERDLAEHRYSTYATQTREMAARRASREWMFNGEKLYTELRKHYPLYAGEDRAPSCCCFETFPHVAACALSDERLFAKNKCRDRRDIVSAAGIDTGPLKNQDFVDAAICALVAYSVNIDYCDRYGNAEEGFILTPPLH